MRVPRLMLAAPHSGSGKTLVTCGLLQALIDCGEKPASFKCGPDYIDPMFHSRVIRVPSRNLDPFFTGGETLRYLLSRDAKRHTIAILEGVMGYYDGVGGTEFQASSYDLARQTETPVVLVVDARGMSRSVIPLIQGFARYREDAGIRGVICNRMNGAVYQRLRPLIERETGLHSFGYVPMVPELVIESRHLGLVTPDGVEDLAEKIRKLADILKETVDLPALIGLAGRASEIYASAPRLPEPGKPVRLAIAEDEAFCFFYEDNRDVLRRLGAELIPFSPLRDSSLPDGIQGLILPGGYPELYADTLEKNVSMRESVRRALRGGLPCLAECGGFLYLHRELEDMEGHAHAGAGFIDGKAFRTRKLGRFGYITLRSNRQTAFGEAGTAIRAHEFHYFESTSCGDAFTAEKPAGARSWPCIHGTEKMILGFPHLYYYSNPEAIRNFLLICSV